MKKQLFILGLLLITATSGFAQFTLNATVPAKYDACYVSGAFNGWPATPSSYVPLTYVSTSTDGLTKLYSTNALPLSFATAGNFNIFAGLSQWTYNKTPATLTPAGAGSTSQDVVVTDWNSAIYYTYINVTVPLAVSECYFIGNEVGWTLPTNAKKMTLSATNADTKVFSYSLESTWNSTHTFGGIFYAGLNGTSQTYRQSTPYGNFTNPGTGNTVNFTVSAFSAIYSPVTTAVENATNDNAILKVIDNKIVADGVSSNVSIFDVRGSLIQSVNTKGMFTSKALNSGLYIIRVDNKAYKQVIN